MKYAVISDIHANASALRQALADAAAQGAEQVVCLGDIVGYGPLPKETLARVRTSCATVLAGNHDDAVSGRQGADDFIDLAGDAVKRHREALDRDGLGWLKALPYTCELEGAIAAHGDFTDPKAFNYVDDEQSAADNFKATDAPLMFVGHTHVPCLFLTGHSGKVYRLEPQDFVLEPGKRYIVNPGSVGYPRDRNGTCQSSYVLYDSATRTVAFRCLPFAVSSVMQRGVNPKRIGIAAALVLAAAAVVSSVFLFASKPAVEKEILVEVAKSEDLTLVIAKKTLTLARAMKKVRANLKVGHGSPPVDLVVEFKSAAGEPVGRPLGRLVLRSCAADFKIPPGAVTAQFTVLKQKPGDQPGLVSFAPSAK